MSEPPLTPMRIGLLRSRATAQIVANCSSRRLPVPTLPGLIRYLSSASAHVGIAREQQVAVVVEIADEWCRDPGVEHPALDFGNRCGRFRHVHSHPDHVRPGLGELDALLRGPRRIGGVRHGHRLDDDRRAAADLDGPDADANRFMKPQNCHGINTRSYHPGSVARGSCQFGNGLCVSRAKKV